jgi:hypothetical protein
MLAAAAAARWAQVAAGMWLGMLQQQQRIGGSSGGVRHHWMK